MSLVLPREEEVEKIFSRILSSKQSCERLMETFYEIVGANYKSKGDYAVYVFHDRYDIPMKGTDHERQGESEKMYEYLICVICPVSGDYEPGEPECGFLFPAFMDESAALNYIDIFSRMQIEQLLLKYHPTIIFVEHDKTFCEKIATKIIKL